MSRINHLEQVQERRLTYFKKLYIDGAFVWVNQTATVSALSLTCEQDWNQRLDRKTKLILPKLNHSFYLFSDNGWQIPPPLVKQPHWGIYEYTSALYHSHKRYASSFVYEYFYFHIRPFISYWGKENLNITHPPPSSLWRIHT